MNVVMCCQVALSHSVQVPDEGTLSCDTSTGVAAWFIVVPKVAERRSVR